MTRSQNLQGDISLRPFFGYHKCATGWIGEILPDRW
jgi:hypothetical protein